jgi:hypothetical protein
MYLERLTILKALSVALNLDCVVCYPIDRATSRVKV